MKKLFAFLLAVVFSASVACAQDAKALRVFIRGNTKTHGPGQHDHPRFLKDWQVLLNERGAKASGSMKFPTGEELEGTDVLVLYSQDAGTIKAEDRANLDKFLKRGGGIVAIHDSVVGNDPQWFKTIIGGAWENGYSKWLEGEVGEYFIDTEHPITKGVSNFDWKDEIYWNLHMMPEAHILASSFHTPFVIAPQMWTYEKENYRSFVCIPGHEYTSFALPHFRAILLRGIAWAGKRENVDYLCSKEELGSLAYPVGGPTAPDKALAKMAVHPDFDMKLVASEPLIEKVISMDWDNKGRLWVAETPEYPNGRLINRDEKLLITNPSDPAAVKTGDKEDRPARDRISWLEDTDGDGVMDKKHVFADGLELVTSLVFYKDGVIVDQAPEILWLRDTNGDGKCDMQGERVVLYTGFGNSDTHAVINNLRRGMDGWIYSAIGYSAGNPKSPSGKEFGRVTAGIIRFKPDGSAVEQVTAGSCNTWGFDFAADGEMFYTTATCGEHFLHIVMPEKAVARANMAGLRSSAVIPDHQEIFPAVHHTRPAYVQIDWVGKFTAAAGSCIYTGGVWPEKYDNSHFCSETTMSLLHNEMVKPNGVTYVASKEKGREETEFVAGSDLWFRPIHSRVGPDGALYLVDFYNQAAIHNDTRGPKHGAHNAAVRPDRDHHLGRIWRIQHKQSKAVPASNVAGNNHKDWVAALTNPNGWTRMTATQLLIDNNAADVVPDLKAMVKSGTGYSRIHAMWVLNDLGKLDEVTEVAAATANDPALRKNVYRAIAESETRTSSGEREMTLQAVSDSDARVQLNALLALAAFEPSPEVAQVIVSKFGLFADPHTQAAAMGVVAKDPTMFLKVAMESGRPELAGFVGQAARLFAAQGSGATPALIALIADQPAKADALKKAALESLAANSRTRVTWNDNLKAAMQKLLGSGNPTVSAAALPLVARWDESGSLSAEVKSIVAPLLGKLNDTTLSDEDRGQLAVTLVGVRSYNSDTIPAVSKILGSTASPALQRRVLETLGSVSDASVASQLVATYPKLPYELREAALGQITKRAESTTAFLDALEKKQIDLAMVGPNGLHRLRTHPEKAVAERANAVIDAIRGPEMKEKNTLIATFSPAVELEGNVEKGKALFTQNCATCHKFKGEGRDVAPDLTGMGAHGPQDLLVHILDPNRVVEPNFITVSIETKDDLSYDGIVTRENRTSILLRNAAGDIEVQQNNIKAKRSTGMSLMPNGFESLGEDGLRDLISYLCADEKRFRILDLRSAFTADTTKGLFITQQNTNDSVWFKRYGAVKVGDIPFDIINPVVSPSGKNVIVLKGGSGFAKTLPQKVEIKAGVKANTLHFLGGIAGWGFPFTPNNGLDVAKATVRYADGKSEEIMMKNGVEFADWVGKNEVPGSKDVTDQFVRRGQMRWFTKPLKQGGTIQSISLESFDNAVAPVFVAITAEQSDKPLTSTTTAAPAAPAAKPADAPATKPTPIDITAKTLIVGGGSSHNFDRWFNKEDVATLSKAFIDVQYTDQPAAIPPEAIEKLDVLYLSNNQPIRSKEVRDAIMARANAGKGLLLVHPALWYNWNDWPEYNRELVAGGARSHDKYQEFEVTVTQPDHPIMKGVPTEFRITDELYHFVKDTKGPAINVLAVGKNIETGQLYPLVWTTDEPGKKIVCITLGHDEKSHGLPAFQTLLVNAHNWARGSK